MRRCGPSCLRAADRSPRFLDPLDAPDSAIPSSASTNRYRERPCYQSQFIEIILPTP